MFLTGYLNPKLTFIGLDNFSLEQQVILMILGGAFMLLIGAPLGIKGVIRWIRITDLEEGAEIIQKYATLSAEHIEIAKLI
jgi:hypothetical protein